MRVLLDGGLFDEAHGARFHRELLAIFGWGYDGRHVIAAEPGCEPALERWLSALDQHTRDQCQLALSLGLHAELEESTARFTIHVATFHDDEGHSQEGDKLLLSPRGAMDLLGRPLRLLVEDRQADGAFLKVIARRGRYGVKLGKIIEKGWAEVDSTGGVTNNHSWIDNQTREAKTRARVRARLWVLFDSDALDQEKPHENSASLKRLCRRRGLAHHMLERRAIENYLPLPLLDAWRCQGSPEEQRKNKARVNALRSLTPRQGRVARG